MGPPRRAILRACGLVYLPSSPLHQGGLPMRHVALLVLSLLLFASSLSAAPAPLPKPERKKEPEKLLKDQQQVLDQTLELAQVQNVRVVFLLNAQQVQGKVRVFRVMQVPPPAPPK